MKLDPADHPRSVSYQWLIGSIVPRPIAWTSTLNEDGSANLAPFSFFTGVGSEPPMCLIVVSGRDDVDPPVPKDTWRNIERQGEYVIHVVPDALAQAMNLTSTNFPYGFDEIVAAELTKVPSERVAPPRIAESPIAMECRLDRIVTVGRGMTAIIIGEVLLWHVRDELVVEGRLDMAGIDAIGRLAGAWYTRTRDLFTMPRPRLPKPTGG